MNAPTGQIRRRKVHRGKKDALSFSVIPLKPRARVRD